MPFRITFLGACLAVAPLLHAATPDKSNAASPLSITGEVTNIQAHEDKRWMDFRVSLHFHFINRSSRPIFLFAKKDVVSPAGVEGDKQYGPLGAWPCLVGATLADSRTDVYLKKYLYSSGARPAANPQGWNATHRRLDQASPPAELIHVIEPGGSWNSEDMVYLGIDKEPLIISDDRNKLWSQIKDIDPRWLQVEFMTWSNNLEYEKFGDRLQKRWKNQGQLVTDDVLSEPIVLHLPVP
jgi:hypothetical protein